MKLKLFLIGLLCSVVTTISWAQTTDLPVTTVEYQALVDFYDTTDGDNWTNKWDITTNNIHTGSWYGVVVEDGHIVEINLGSNNLTGAIPDSFKNLEYLRNLDLFDSTTSSRRNDLSVTDADGLNSLDNLSELANLEFLDLAYCSLSGSLPESWSKLTQLQTLNLYANNLEGSIFEGIGELKSLTTLNLYNNSFTGFPSDIGGLESLVTFNIYTNNISGSLPKELEELTALRTLGVSNNNLSGIDAFLPTTVSLTFTSQTLSLDNFTYVGEDVVLDNLPEITKYNKSTNDFSLRPNFRVYLRGSLIETLTMAEDGTLTIPVEYISSLGQDDDLYLQHYSIITGASYFTRINFETITLDLPAVPEEEYEALVDFYNAMNGENWLGQWPIETNTLNEGAWEGVSTEGGHITEIELRDERVQGAIPVTFSNLKYLKKLDLHDNDYFIDYGNGIGLSATDLNNLSGLESLEYLDLSYCSLSGSLPESWSNLTQLQELYLYNNALEGFIFEGIGELKSLRTLNLYNNSFTDFPSDMGGLESLTTLNLYNNSFTDFPSDIGGLESLVTFNIYTNNISGSLPKELEELTALRTLGVSNNNLSGIDAFLPTTVSLTFTSQTLSLDNFTYEGEDVVLDNLPEITKYNKSTNDFSLRPNFRLYLRGSLVETLTMAEDGTLTIPVEYISSLGQDDDLYLQHYSIITGASYFTRINFETITLDLPAVPEEEYEALVDFYNAMNGENWLGQWPIETNTLNEGAWEGVSTEGGHITEIELRDERVQGAIPVTFSNLKYLKKLDLHDNDYFIDYGNGIGLSATDLNNLSGLESLEYLDLSYCSLSGSLPESWSNLTQLQELYLYNNSLEGFIFEGIGELKSLRTLNLYNNSFTGFPSDMGGLESLTTLNLYNNSFTDFPSDIGGLESLVTFNIYTNNISGSLPKELEELTALRTLGVSNNNLSGIDAFLPTTVSLTFTSQTLSLDNFTYAGEDVVLDNLPEITKYNKSTNDFSLRPNFRLYLRGTLVETLTMAEDGTLTIPVEYISSLGQDDDLYLQHYSIITGASYFTRINFETITLDLPAVPEEEYEALVDFYNAMNGKNWNDQWPIETNTLDEGAWEGVSVEGGHIARIELRDDRVQGTIPESFSDLKHLKKLDLYNNDYSTDYGNGIGLSATDLNNLSGLESLEYLDLSYCNLSGSLPESWSNLTELQTLILNNNALENIDESFNVLRPESLNFQFQNITYDSIEVNGDQISVDLPRYMVIEYEDSAEDVVLTYNANNEFRLYVNGSNEKTTFSNDGNVTFSDISLLGLQETDQIRIYQVDGIALGSEINYTSVNFGLPLVDKEFEILKQIYESTDGANWTNTWDITENTVNQVGWYGVSLRDGHIVGLDLFNNELTGTIPAQITGLAYLKDLNLSSNNLSGSLPDDLENLTALEYFDVNSNQLSGTITPNIVNLTALKKFAIGDNNFEGSIPSALSDFESLEHLDISSNGFDNIEKKLYYDFSTTYIDLRTQIINYDIILNLTGSVLEVELPDIVSYDLENNNFDAKNDFSLLVNNLTHDTTTINDEGEIIFDNVRISEIPLDATITIRQTTGSFLNTEYIFAGIEDKSNVPVEAKEYQALVSFQEKLNGDDWTNTWDTSSNNIHLNSWYGVTTYDGHIVGLDLSENNISGNISDVFEDLPLLTELDVSSNSITDLDEALPSDLNISIDRQVQDMGTLNLSRTATITDNSLNRYNHSNGDFINQTYYLTIGSFSKSINMPLEGIKLIDLITNWKVPNGEQISLRQNSGDAINSVVNFDLDFKEGDANIDDTVNILDIQTTINHILSDYIPYFNYYAADINEDDSVNILDLIGQVNEIQNSTSSSAKALKSLNNNATNNSTSLTDTSLVGMVNGQLILNPNGFEVTGFQVVLENVTTDQVEEMVSGLDFTFFLNEEQNQVSIIGYSLSSMLGDQTVLANIDATDANIVSVLMSDVSATEIPTQIIYEKALSSNDIDVLEQAGVELESEPFDIKNYPNPFTQTTSIEFFTNQAYLKGTILLFDFNGKKVYEEKINTISKGNNTYTFNKPNSISSGIYHYRINLGTENIDESLKGKMIIN